MNHAIKATAHEIKIRRVAYFYSAAERRSRGALWPSFAPALIRGDKQKIAQAFRVAAGLEDVEFTESLDCAPGSVQPVISVSEDGERQLSLMRWGFKLPDRLLFNVRAEGVEKAKFWKDKFQNQRCIVPATSYFEWQDCDTKPKPKYEIDVPGGGLFGIAGVWASWKNPRTDQWEKTFSTFTTEPNALIAKIHIRQPVILEFGELGEWLSESERPPSHLLRITSEKRMTMTQVSSGRPAGPRSGVATTGSLFD
jgi:putative SOS response-associated peptidase YedK